MKFKKHYTANWRKYQAKLKRSNRVKRLLKRLALLCVILGCVFTGLSFFYFADSRFSEHSSQTSQQPPRTDKNLHVWPEKLSRKAFSDYLISRSNGSKGETDQFVFENNGSRFRIKSTLDTHLQKYIDRLLRQSRTLQAAVVVLDPYDGRILAMISRDTENNNDNICLKADFPAASLFKIISAAAALEAAEYTLDQALFYQGGRHTLYKYQLKESKVPYSAKTNFRKAFATSNNSVFGKIGIYVLGQEVIVEYAEKFFFNRPIPFDLPVAVSAVEVPEDDFGIAEIASGFNKRTQLSPFHAALLSAVIANCGDFVVPWLVSTITDETDQIVYRARHSVLNSAISRKTAEDLKMLMQYTVRYGTSRTAFQQLRRKKVFYDLVLGAKTGTINDRQDRFKYDWITAFALTSDGTKGICLGILAVHGKKLGTRSTELARAIIDYQFSSWLVGE
jgi:cell division protein FtsI/penicillin-binding protein 2